MQLIDVSPVLAVHRRVITGLIFCFQRGIVVKYAEMSRALLSFWFHFMGFCMPFFLSNERHDFFTLAHEAYPIFRKISYEYEKKRTERAVLFTTHSLLYTRYVSLFCWCCQFINLDVHCVYGHAWNVTATVKRSACCLFCLLFLPPNLLYLFHCHDSRRSK